MGVRPAFWGVACKGLPAVITVSVWFLFLRKPFVLPWPAYAFFQIGCPPGAQRADGGHPWKIPCLLLRTNFRDERRGLSLATRKIFRTKIRHSQQAAFFPFTGSVEMMSKPIIGMNADFRAAAGDTPAFSYVGAGYFESILKAGGIPQIIPPLDELDDIEQVLDGLDGVLLVGGADLDPQRDGWMLHPTVKPLDPRRETFDRGLAKLVCERRMPLFGIGVGMQLMNVTMGGNLLLHIPEDRPQALPHRDALDPAHRHTLEILPGSLLDRVYGDGELRVNSRHHMAIDEVAPGFAVTAKCPDGIIEGIESKSPDWFALGTQFHPEANTASALDMRIFDEFIDGIKAGIDARIQDNEEAVRLVA